MPWQVLGTPMIPCMMMVLGAVLHKGPGSAHVPARLILGVSAFRLIIIPLAGEAPLPACQLSMQDFTIALSGPIKWEAHHTFCAAAEPTARGVPKSRRR